MQNNYFYIFFCNFQYNLEIKFIIKCWLSLKLCSIMHYIRQQKQHHKKQQLLHIIADHYIPRLHSNSYTHSNQNSHPVSDRLHKCISTLRPPTRHPPLFLLVFVLFLNFCYIFSFLQQLSALQLLLSNFCNTFSFSFSSKMLQKHIHIHISRKKVLQPLLLGFILQF